MSNFHESGELLDEKTKNISRAISSLKEEIEAVDWYNQRVVASKDEELKKIMAHNRDEEIEHACMTIEWLRRNMDKWDEELKTYLFTDKSIIDVEEGHGEENGDSSGKKGLNIGNLK